MATRAALRAAARLREAADRLEPLMRARVLRALRSLQDAVPMDRLERALAARDVFAIHDLAGSLPARLRPAVRTLGQAHAQGLSVGASALRVAGFPVRFDGLNPFAVEAARASAGEFVTRVTGTTRQAIRTVVSRAFTEGIPSREAARLIQPLIGLTPRATAAVVRHRADLLASGASRAAAARSAKRYADRLLRRRAETIARTEIARAAVDGELAAWREAERLGFLPRSEKVWIVADDDRLCRFCRPMEGQRVPLAGQFRSALGRADGPPLHPNCRCAVAVEPVARQPRRAA